MAASKPLAFCEAHAAGLCSVVWLPGGGSGAAALLTAGPDGRLCYRKPEAPGEVLKDIENSRQGDKAAVHCLAATAGRPVLTGDDQNFVKCYSHPAGELINVATRFTLPVRALALSASGLNLAAGGDDEGLKLVDVESYRVFRQLKSQAYTRSLAWDPESVYLGSVNGDGTLNVWEVESGKQALCRRKACPKVELASMSRSQLAWHPDGGSLLAAPGTDHDVVLYERMSWEPAFSLSGQHSADVSLVAFCKNGLYLVSAAADQAVVLWDVNERKVLEKRLLPGCATDLAWHPTQNALAIITEDGQLTVWEGLVPAKLPSPTADVDALAGIKSKDPPGAGVLAAAAGMADGGSVLEGVGGEGTAVDDYDREDSFLADSGPKLRGPRRGRRGFGGFGLELPAPQDPIQPGSTEIGDMGRRYLAYTPLGCITLRQEEDHNVVEVTFHDTNAMRKRIPLLSDFYSFTMGCLGEKGALYASRSTSESQSTVVYRPFESWAQNSDWTLTLPKGEEAECAAAGGSFCALATSRRQLRFFSQAGTQTHITTLPGQPVTLAARGHQLAAVWHGAAPTPAGDQCLHYSLYDVAEQRQLHAGPLPLSPGSTLSWVGFSEEGLLAAYDSEQELRVRSPDFGGSWVTLFSAAAERKSTEQYWLVGLSAKELQCIVCANTSEPAVPSGNARPVVTVVPLRPPVVAQDGVVAPLEADLIRHNTLLSHLAAEARDGEEAGELEAVLHSAQLEADRISLRLIQKLLASDRTARALETASTLHNLPALEGALKLASHHRASALADRISLLIEQRMAMEAEAAAEAEAEEEALYQAELGGQRQHGSITPVPGPAFTDLQQASPAAAATAGAASRAPSPAPRATLTGMAAAGGNPFSRKPVGEMPENSPGTGNAAAAHAAAAAKRKAPAGNPFARKSKAAKA
ncbi:WD repeat and HMG-box DNA-binding 1 isoform B [Micractinium conductrix]|uniref:WD repeat and HMG-box DNA-binding 1 isoform B n=1 Tax=Micractinium conductrix TaxID=554055 RepID=A0A2P6V544_9CHLO|nr:WD repeat and HMG-box DNA-binding 1 isoform B [Micractinium conductrix]|eukprot:PSC69197.1 WD repeat and HMG-box DNA-binding 1 isoform B [Micractinium conductrix]